MVPLRGLAKKASGCEALAPPSRWQTLTFLGAFCDRFTAVASSMAPIKGEIFRAYVEQHLLVGPSIGDGALLRAPHPVLDSSSPRNGKAPTSRRARAAGPPARAAPLFWRRTIRAPRAGAHRRWRRPSRRRQPYRRERTPRWRAASVKPGNGKPCADRRGGRRLGGKVEGGELIVAPAAMPVPDGQADRAERHQTGAIGEATHR